MNFKIGDKVKVVSLSNTFNFLMNKKFLDFLNKIFTVCDTFTTYNLIHDIKQCYVTVKENDYHWNEKDLILVNNNLEIE